MIKLPHILITYSCEFEPETSDTVHIVYHYKNPGWNKLIKEREEYHGKRKCQLLLYLDHPYQMMIDLDIATRAAG